MTKPKESAVGNTVNKTRRGAGADARARPEGEGNRRNLGHAGACPGRRWRVPAHVGDGRNAVLTIGGARADPRARGRGGVQPYHHLTKQCGGDRGQTLRCGTFLARQPQVGGRGGNHVPVRYMILSAASTRACRLPRRQFPGLSGRLAHKPSPMSSVFKVPVRDFDFLSPPCRFNTTQGGSPRTRERGLLRCG